MHNAQPVFPTPILTEYAVEGTVTEAPTERPPEQHIEDEVEEDEDDSWINFAFFEPLTEADVGCRMRESYCQEPVPFQAFQGRMATGRIDRPKKKVTPPKKPQKARKGVKKGMNVKNPGLRLRWPGESIFHQVYKKRIPLYHTIFSRILIGLLIMYLSLYVTDSASDAEKE